MERSGVGWKSNPPKRVTVRKHGRGKELLEKLTLRGTHSSDIIAAVLIFTSTTQQLACYRVAEAGPEEEEEEYHETA